MIEKIWEIYENLNEIVYVSDADTYDLIYMNRKAREIFRNISIDELKKRKCYEILQNANAPCAICTNDKIADGDFYEWIYYNPIAEKHYLLKDTILKENGRRYRMEIAIDITVQQRQKQIIESFVNTEKLVNEALKRVLAEDDQEKAIMIFLEYIGRAFHGERAYIFEETKSNVLTNTYEWCTNQVSVQKDNLADIPAYVLNDWYAEFKHDKSIVIKNLEDIKYKSPIIYNILKPQDIQTLVACPLVYQKKIIGFYGIDNPPAHLLDNIVVMLNVMASFMVSIINKRDLFRRISDVSYYDSLTGAGNRYAMENVINDLDLDKSIGIIYSDVIGLKNTNDTKGHLEGDKLILNVYKLICRYFSKDSVFRVGGDEFVIICSDISQKEFESQINDIKSHMDKNGEIISIGYLWKANCRENVQSLIIEADQLMYKQKREFYNIQSKKKEKEKNILCRYHKAVGMHEYFIRQHNFNQEAFLKAVMQSSFSLNIFVGDLQDNIYYISDTLRYILGATNNIVYDLFHIWSLDLPDHIKKLFLEKWNNLIKNKQEYMEFEYNVCLKNKHRVGVLKIDVRWDSAKQIPLFCTGIFVR